MQAHETVPEADVAQDQPLSYVEMRDFMTALFEQVPVDELDPQKVRWYLAQKGRIGEDLQPVRSLFLRPIPPVDLREWTSFYRRIFKREIDLSGLYVPLKPDYPCRAIVNPRGITNNQAFDACTKRFNGKTWRYVDDLDTVTDVVKRHDGPYAIWVRDVVEADEDLKDLSADQLSEQKVDTETLFERMVHELKYHDETQRHLDLQNWTLCAGSRYADGNVPYCSWGVDEFRVRWTDVHSARSHLRSRRAVS